MTSKPSSTGWGLERFALWGEIHAGPVAITYAARNPERVSRLLLWHSYARASDFLNTSRLKAFRALANADWELYTESIVTAAAGFGIRDPGEAQRAAAVLRESVSPEVVRLAFAATDEFDVSNILKDVRCPTLVMHRRRARLVGPALARSLAAGIPKARLMLFEGDSHQLQVGDSERVVQAVEQFLDEDEQPSPPALRADPSPEVGERGDLGAAHTGMTAILFADIADSTALTERLGDAAFREKARELDGALWAAIRERGGTPVEGKLLGDGVLAVFTSAREAIEAALVCGDAGRHAGLPLHLGIHAGDVIREDNNVYGGAVNIASRISGLSAPGEVLVSETVRSLARTSAGVRFEDRGEQALKGVGEAVRVWAVVAATDSLSADWGTD